MQRTYYGVPTVWTCESGIGIVTIFAAVPILTPVKAGEDRRALG